MDIGLHYADEYILDKVYDVLLPSPSFDVASSSVVKNATELASSYTLSRLPPTSLLPRDSIVRQCISLYLMATIGAAIMYFLFSAGSYYFFFDRRLEHHPRFLRSQIKLEIQSSLRAIPTIGVLTLPWLLGDVRGWSAMYDRLDQSPLGEGVVKGWAWIGISVLCFLGFTDFAIYWIHRWLHLPFLYKHFHKPHHKWVVPTPFAALAFHPIDGYSQSVPYHIFVYIFPVHKVAFLVLFVFVQLWTILIHDGDMISGHLLERYINSPAHHTLHHLYFTCNYGQYFTWADSHYDSYRAPRPTLDPILDSLKNMEKQGLVEKGTLDVAMKEAVEREAREIETERLEREKETKKRV